VSTLRVTLESASGERVPSGDVFVVATVTNIGGQPALFHRHQAERGSLVLHIEDPSGRRILLPPPTPPDERDLAAASTLAAGESISFRYVGFLDARREPGRYRIRGFSSHEALGGTREAPLASDWIHIDVVSPAGITREPPTLDIVGRVWRQVLSAARNLIAIVARYFCRATLEKEVDYFVTEKIENGSPASWNNTYSWNARFHVLLDQPQKRIVVTIRVRLANASPVQQWVTTVQNAWSNRFKDCATVGCASNGYPITLVFQYVSSGEHYVLNLASSRTTDMLHWGLVDGDQAHEAGHMLGNKEEYFTVDGVDYGPGRQPGGNIMNNPDNPPIAAHYWLIQSTIDQMLGINYSLAGGSTRRIDVPCSYI